MCSNVVIIAIVLLRIENSSATMNQLYLKIDSGDTKDTIIEIIRNATDSVSTIDDLYLSIKERDFGIVNGEIMHLYQQLKIKRHHIEFCDNMKGDWNDMSKSYESLSLLSGCSVQIIESKDVVKLFSNLHTLKNLRTVKLTLSFHTTENIDSFYETFREFPSNTVEQISIDNFLPYAVMFKVIRGFVQQSPNLNRITLYSALTPNAFKHFKDQYVKEIEALAQKPLTIYIRTKDRSVVEQKFGLVSLKSLNEVEESQFEREYPFFVK